jgi:hypothetical protein
MKRNETSTQSIEAVAGLMKFMGKPADPLPEFVDFSEVKLVRSNKGDVFYCVTANSCSCPSAFYRPGRRCKHQRKYFPGLTKTQAEIDAEFDAENEWLHKAKWMGGFNGPCEPSEIVDWAEATTANVQDPKSRQNQEA